MERRPSVPLAIPPEQIPLNEYEELRGSSFFRWATLEPRRWLSVLLIVWAVSWIISGPVAAWSYRPTDDPGLFLLAGSAGALVPVFLVLTRLYLGWSYIYDRLNKVRVAYEETGAHDGDWWTKPSEVHAKDKLIVEYQILPVLRRLRRTIAAVSALAGINGLLWWLG